MKQKIVWCVLTAVFAGTSLFAVRSPTIIGGCGCVSKNEVKGWRPASFLVAKVTGKDYGPRTEKEVTNINGFPIDTIDACDMIGICGLTEKPKWLLPLDTILLTLIFLGFGIFLPRKNRLP